MCKSSLSDYSYAYILVKVTIPVAAATFAASNNDNKKLVLKIVLHLLIAKSKINNTKINNAQDIDVVISIYNSIDYSKNLSRTSAHQL